MYNKRSFLSVSFLLCTTLCSCTITNSGGIILSGLNDNQEIDIMPEAEREYVSAMKSQAENISNDYIINDLNGDMVKIADYYENYTCGKGITITLKRKKKLFEANKEYNFHISKNKDFKDEVTYTTKSEEIKINSLYSSTTYYWKVSDNKHDSRVYSFKTKEGHRGIDAGSAINIRDIGGWKTKNGKRIKQGLIYRGCELNSRAYEANGVSHNQTLNEWNINVFNNELKVGTEIDFRGDAEANNMTSSNLGNNVVYKRETISGYGSLLTDKTSTKVKNIFLEFLNARVDSSVYYHCMGGADRTGTISFLLGGLLGMSYTDLIIDFELTSFSYNLREHDVLGKYSDFPGLISTLKQVTESDENEEISTMCEKWLTSSYCGLTKENIRDLKDLLLED